MSIIQMLYSTVIYRETEDTITLDNGGWVTATSARKMNQMLDAREVMGRVTIRKGQMFFNDAPFIGTRFVAKKMQEVA
jgi:hypothetical protein